MTDISSIELRAQHRELKVRRDESQRAQRKPERPSPSAHRPRGLAEDYTDRRFQSLGNVAFAAVTMLFLLIGWVNRHENYLTPEEGLGYQLGIVGGVLMLALFLYPFRKKARLLRRLGRVSHWFRMHMIMGVLGPVLILYHANFQLGSMNSSIALFAMLSVVASGFVGRFIYRRVHVGLYGKKARMTEILADTETLKVAIGHDLSVFEPVAGEIREFENKVLVPYQGVVVSALSVLLFHPRAYFHRKAVMRIAKASVQAQSANMGWSRREQRRRLKAANLHLSQYFVAARKAAQFAFYERLSSQWRVLHYPLFFFLIGAAVIHIVAVHLY